MIKIGVLGVVGYLAVFKSLEDRRQLHLIIGDRLEVDYN